MVGIIKVIDEELRGTLRLHGKKILFQKNQMKTIKLFFNDRQPTRQ